MNVAVLPFPLSERNYDHSLGNVPFSISLSLLPSNTQRIMNISNHKCTPIYSIRFFTLCFFGFFLQTEPHEARSAIRGSRRDLRRSNKLTRHPSTCSRGVEAVKGSSAARFDTSGARGLHVHAAPGTIAFSSLRGGQTAHCYLGH